MNKKGLIVSGILILCLVGGYVGFGMYRQAKIEETPTTHIAYALTQNDYGAAKGNIKFKVNRDSELLTSEVEDETVDYLANLIENIKIKVNYNSDLPENNLDKLKLHSFVGLEYSDSPVISADVYYDALKVGMTSDQLMDYGISADLNKELSKELDFEFKEIKFNDFYQVLIKEDELMKEFKGGYQKYLDVYGEVLDDKFEKSTETIDGAKCDSYTVELTYKDQMKLFSKMMKVVENDKALKALTKDRVLKVIGLIESDYIEYFDAPQEEVEKKLKEARTNFKKDFDKNWDKMFVEMEKNINSNSNALENLENGELKGLNLEETFKQEMKYFITKDNRVKKTSISVKTPVGTLTEEFVLSEGGNVETDLDTFKDFNEIDEDSLTQEVTYNAMDNVLNSEGMKKFRKDSKELATNEESKMLSSYLQMMFMGQ